MKIILLAIVLAGASLAQPSFAKEVRAHHVGVTKGTARKNAKGPKSSDTKPSDTIDAGVTALPPRQGVTPNKARHANAGLKIAKPGDFQARRVPERSNSVVRNAIGQPIAEQSPAGGAKHIGFSVQPPAAASGGTVGLAKSARAIGGLSSVRQSPHPVAPASIANRGQIDGAGLICPAVAPSALGGPAKAVSGINGTTLRPKR